MRIFLALVALALLWVLPEPAAAQQVNLYCWVSAGPPTQWAPCSSTNPMQITGSFSATTTGFPGTSQTTGTPISVTTGGVTGTLPAGTVVVASNVGATNNAYCKLGASASVNDQLIPPLAWFAFTVGSNTQLTCITSTSTTTVNMVGGAGLPTGAGGGGGGGSGGTVTLGAGSAIAGKFGIDQTTPGTTNRVQDTGSQVWKAGTLQGLTWGASGFSTEVNSVVNGNAILAASAINNSTALDQYFDVSVSLGSITPGAGAPYIGFYIYALNQDGTTYGDGRFGTSAAGPPPSQYFAGSVPCVASTAGVITGIIRGVLLPPGQFKLVLYNQAGATLAASANTIQIRSYNSGLN